MLTARIAGLIGLALAPALAIQAYNLHVLMETREADVRAEVTHYASLAAAGIARYGDSLRDTLGILSRAPALHGDDREACRATLERSLPDVPGAFLLAVTDEAGNVACNTLGSGSGSYSVAARGYFREAMSKDGMAVGGYVKGMVTGRPTMQVARALRDPSGRRKGILLASIDLSWFADSLKQPGLPRGGVLTVADRDGLVLARDPDNDAWIGHRLSPESIAMRLGAVDARPVNWVGLDGRELVAGVKRVGGSLDGMSVVYGIDQRVAFAAARAALLRETMQVLIGLALAVSAALVAGRQLIRKPVERLSRAGAAWERGELGVRTLLSGRTELGRLGRTFDRMAASLQANEADLRDALARAEAMRERQALMLHELNHRVKNTLAVVQSLARQARSGEDGPENLERRILALSKTHDLLTRTEWTAAPLRRVLEDELGPYGGEGEACALAGPDVDLAPRIVLALGMTVHELTTNAAKYGALSRPGGRVCAEWEVRGGRELRLRWRESGGPPVAKPRRRGFGTRLIAAGIDNELGGRATLDFAPRGLDCELVIPLGQPGDAGGLDRAA